EVVLRVPAEDAVRAVDDVIVLLLGVVLQHEEPAGDDARADPADAGAARAPGGRQEPLVAEPGAGEGVKLQVFGGRPRHFGHASAFSKVPRWVRGLQGKRNGWGVGAARAQPL